MKKCMLLTAVASTVALSSAAQAALLGGTNFNATTYVDGPLVTATGTTTPGQDGFLTSSGAGTNNISVANTASNGFVSLATSGQDVRKPLDSAATATTSSSVFLAADINLSAAQAGGDYFLHLGDNSTNNFYARIFARSVTGGYQLGETTGSGSPTTYGAVLNFGETYRLVARYDFVAGATNDTGALFINPGSDVPTTATPYVAATTIGADATTISSFNLRQGSATNAPTVTSIDNIAVNDVAVPEPTTLGLLGLGGLALLRRKRA